jgi:hypothetical protein
MIREGLRTVPKTNVEFREHKPSDTEASRVLLNDVFPSAPQSVDSWQLWTGSDFTAPVALLDGVLVGAIPLKRRVYQVAPGAQVTAWVEHRVGVAEAHRDKGLGSGMQSCAKEFLRGRGDILLVHRGAERSPGYRFYEKNGLLDVSYVRSTRFEPLSAPVSPAGVRWLDPDEFFAHAGRWHKIFQACYGRFGGYVVRTPGYLRSQRESGIWRRAILHEFSCAVLSDGGRVAGYGVFGERQGVLTALEVAVRNRSPDLVARLLQAARGKGMPVVARSASGGLMEEASRRMGAPPPARESGAMCIMVHVLDIETTGRNVWNPVPELEDVEVRVWTPDRDGVIHRPAAPARSVTVELKEHMLARLLMRRLDLRSAVREERVTLHNGTAADADALSEALSPCPWAFQQVDYL